MSTNPPAVGKPAKLAGSPSSKPVGKDEFLRLSSALTGFGTVDLQGTGVAEEFLAVLRRIAPAPTRDLLYAWREIERTQPPAQHDEALRARILDDPRLGPLAWNVVTLWYTGTWAQLPAAWRYAYGASPADTSHVVSALAYQESLVWKAAGTHPMGARQPGFGTWALPPRPLAHP